MRPPIPHLSVLLVVTFSLVGAEAAFGQMEGEDDAIRGTCGFDLEDRGFYTFDDFQYFKAPVADIRTPRTMARVYPSEPLPFSGGSLGVDSTRSDRYFDGSFGETFPFVGWNFEPGEIENCMSATGIVTFFQASAHVLIDLDQTSNPVMNTDYRVGFGVSARPLPSFRPLSLKLQGFHESTHLGDEYSLNAAQAPEFRRYNVSYEAVEGLLALDYFDQGATWWEPAYLRTYGGARRLTTGFDLFNPWKRQFEEFVTRDIFGPNPLLAASQWELQFGTELYLGGWARDHLSHGHPWKWQYIMGAVDVSRTNLLDVSAPSTIWSTHAMLGLVWGDYFGSRASNQLTVDWYGGVNPHGQFRNSEVEYVGLTLTIRF